MLWKYHSQGLDCKLITCSPSAGQHYIHIIFAETAVGMQKKCCGINAVQKYDSTHF